MELKQQIESCTFSLLGEAEKMTKNKISHNCKFIISEIKPLSENLIVERALRIKENNKKRPCSLDDLMPHILSLYPNFYDVNLSIFKATRNETIIDISYFSRDSLDSSFKELVKDKPCMWHFKISQPPWIDDSNKKFDINWEHYGLRTRFLTWLQRHKLKFNRG